MSAWAEVKSEAEWRAMQLREAMEAHAMLDAYVDSIERAQIAAARHAMRTLGESLTERQWAFVVDTISRNVFEKRMHAHRQLEELFDQRIGSYQMVERDLSGAQLQ